jgi:NAD(P)-dependent dehydrogenase (short-subunit alcohol dehydrogenase family)
VDTELIRQGFAQSAKIKGIAPEDLLKEFFVDLTPMGRIPKPLDVARAVSFLASAEAEFIIGNAVNVVGGREMH